MLEFLPHLVLLCLSFPSYVSGQTESLAECEEPCYSLPPFSNPSNCKPNAALIEYVKYQRSSRLQKSGTKQHRNTWAGACMHAIYCMAAVCKKQGHRRLVSWASQKCSPDSAGPLPNLILPTTPLFSRTNMQVKLSFPYSFYFINTALPKYFFFITLFRIICIFPLRQWILQRYNLFFSSQSTA